MGVLSRGRRIPETRCRQHCCCDAGAVIAVDTAGKDDVDSAPADVAAADDAGDDDALVGERGRQGRPCASLQATEGATRRY